VFHSQLHVLYRLCCCAIVGNCFYLSLCTILCRICTGQVETVQDNTRQYKTIQDNTRQYKTIQDNTRQYKTIQDNTRQYKTIQDNTIQDKTIQLYTIADNCRQRSSEISNIDNILLYSTVQTGCRKAPSPLQCSLIFLQRRCRLERVFLVMASLPT
jgi:hypothetical protein